MTSTWEYLAHTKSRRRGRNVQWEDQEAEALVGLVWELHKPWWRFAVQRFERRGTGSAESEYQGAKVMRQGYQPGWPDYGLFVPGKIGDAYLELKAGRNRPARSLAREWWIDLDEFRWELKQRGKARESVLVREVKVGDRWQETVCHVTADQLYSLQWMAACGHATCVAYGAEDAYRWLDQQAGPRPEVLPRGWDA